MLTGFLSIRKCKLPRKTKKQFRKFYSASDYTYIRCRMLLDQLAQLKEFLLEADYSEAVEKLFSLIEKNMPQYTLDITPGRHSRELKIMIKQPAEWQRLMR